MEKKVFIGLSDIASFIDDWDFGFKANHFKSLKGSIHYQPSVQNSKLDFVIKKQQDRVGYFKPRRISSKLKPWWDARVSDYYLHKAINECDIFIFFWESFNADFSDYKLLKQKGKKIITVFVGDDVRWESAMKQEFLKYDLPIIEYENYNRSIKGLGNKLRFLRTAEKYSDIIFVASVGSDTGSRAAIPKRRRASTRSSSWTTSWSCAKARRSLRASATTATLCSRACARTATGTCAAATRR